MPIDYAAIAKRLDERKKIYNKPHPWEEGFSIELYAIDWMEYRILKLNRESDEYATWYESYRANNTMGRFFRTHCGVSAIELLTKLLHGQITLPHSERTLCPRCNLIREQRKMAKNLKWSKS